ncbi:MAG: hypothetical protein EAX90_01915 [Candidatus Heimdallarchaeota archaeon]|nr:hypothetical protein [Candidatus Heimdallarchaeota archaeon]
MIIQTDADGTIYKGNLLVSLGWYYLGYLFTNKFFGKFISRLFELPFYYFISLIPNFVHTAFIPFRGCPISLIDKVNNKLKTKWVKLIEKYNPEKIIIISHQDKTLLLGFLKNKKLIQKYNFELISNEGEILKNNFSGKVTIKVNVYTKYRYINKEILFLGDIKDYFRYGLHNKNFLLIR